jgi:hypothetical protein
MTVQHAGRIITRKAYPGDQKDQRDDKKKDLGDDPTALKKTIDERHFSPNCKPEAASRQRIRETATARSQRHAGMNGFHNRQIRLNNG